MGNARFGALSFGAFDRTAQKPFTAVGVLQLPSAHSRIYIHHVGSEFVEHGRLVARRRRERQRRHSEAAIRPFDSLRSLRAFDSQELVISVVLSDGAPLVGLP